MLRKKISIALAILLIPALLLGCEKPRDEASIINLNEREILVTYDDFPSDMETGKRDENGLYTSEKYGFKLQMPENFDLWYKSVLPMGGIKQNQEVGGECFNLVRTDFNREGKFIVGRLCVSVNPFLLTADEWVQVNIKPGTDIDVRSTNNKFVYDFQYHIETQARDNFEDIKKEAEEVLATLETFDLDYQK